MLPSSRSVVSADSGRGGELNEEVSKSFSVGTVVVALVVVLVVVGLVVVVVLAVVVASIFGMKVVGSVIGATLVSMMFVEVSEEWMNLAVRLLIKIFRPSPDPASSSSSSALGDLLVRCFGGAVIGTRRRPADGVEEKGEEEG